VEVVEGLGFEFEVAAVFEFALSFSGEDDGEVVFFVAVAVFHAAAVEDDGVVEEAAVAFVDGFHAFHEVGELLDVPFADFGVLAGVFV